MLRPTMALRLQRSAVLICCLILGACASIRGLDEDPLPLSTTEKARVNTQVDKALAGNDWDAAWNQTVDAGADRSRLEAVALAALADKDGAAPDMFEALVEKWGALTPPARGQVAALVEASVAENDWDRAVELELLTAEDAPTYAAAWVVYDRAPPSKAEAVLAAIVEARSDREKAD